MLISNELTFTNLSNVFLRKKNDVIGVSSDSTKFFLIIKNSERTIEKPFNPNLCTKNRNHYTFFIHRNTFPENEKEFISNENFSTHFVISSYRHFFTNQIVKILFKYYKKNSTCYLTLRFINNFYYINESQDFQDIEKTLRQLITSNNKFYNQKKMNVLTDMESKKDIKDFFVFKDQLSVIENIQFFEEEIFLVQTKNSQEIRT